MQEITTGYQKVLLEDLLPDSANARIHGERNVDEICRSLKEFGQHAPLVVQRSSGRILVGNGRYEAMKRLGWTEAWVLYTDDDNVTAVRRALADNRTAELAEWDVGALSDLVCSLGDGVEIPGWSLEELKELSMSDSGIETGLTDPDDVPEPPDEAITKPGDLWILGNHRLLCGDSAVPEDVDRLLDGARIHLLNTDPPYNVNVEPRSNNAIAAGLSSFGSKDAPEHNHQKNDLSRKGGRVVPTSGKLRPKDRPLANDFLSEEDFARTLRAWFSNAARVLDPGRCFYVWGGYANIANYPGTFRETKLYFSQAIIWVKGHPVLGRKDFMGDHEWCFYGWKEGAGHRFLGPNNVTDVWNVKKVPPQEMVHLTQKPVELAERAMEYSSEEGENVLDLFGGSGTTLIAAERMRRRAFLMELDPLYCDVIVARWEEFTGRKAHPEKTC